MSFTLIVCFPSFIAESLCSSEIMWNLFQPGACRRCWEGDMARTFCTSRVTAHSPAKHLNSLHAQLSSINSLTWTWYVHPICTRWGRIHNSMVNQNPLDYKKIAEINGSQKSIMSTWEIGFNLFRVEHRLTRCPPCPRHLQRSPVPAEDTAWVRRRFAAPIGMVKPDKNWPFCRGTLWWTFTYLWKITIFNG